MDDLVHWKLEAKGIVQGVGYRARCESAAEEFGLVGSVWNDPHSLNTVHIEIQGSKARIESFMRSISGRRGLSDAKSVSVVGEFTVNPELSSFSGR
jgi:acylphosphatase